MKAKTLLLCALLSAGLLPPTSPASAQEIRPRRAPAERGARWQSLSENERVRLRAAHQQALQDAQVRAAHERLIEARQQFRDVMRPALLKADPSVQPILEKLRPARRERDRD